MSGIHIFKRSSLSVLTGLLMSAGISLSASAEIAAAIIGTDQNALFGVDDNVREFLSANRGTNGGGDQSMQGGDAIGGTKQSAGLPSSIQQQIQ